MRPLDAPPHPSPASEPAPSPHPVDAPRTIHASSLTARELGQHGEQLVADSLESAGWRILERNHRLPQGEIDIIALDGRSLVFVEVKTRRTLLTGVPQASVTAAKLRRLRLLAGIYLMDNAPPHVDVRIDVIGVLFGGDDAPAIEHLRAVG